MLFGAFGPWELRRVGFGSFYELQVVGEAQAEVRDRHETPAKRIQKAKKELGGCRLQATCKSTCDTCGPTGGERKLEGRKARGT